MHILHSTHTHSTHNSTHNFHIVGPNPNTENAAAAALAYAYHEVNRIHKRARALIAHKRVRDVRKSRPQATQANAGDSPNVLLPTALRMLCCCCY